MNNYQISTWFSKNIIRQDSSLYLNPEIWEHILSFDYITSPYWREGCYHSIVFKEIIPEYSKDRINEWYGNYWSLNSTPWIETYWSGNRDLEYDEYPLESTRGFQIVEHRINDDIWGYFGVDNTNQLFPLTESFPLWVSNIVKQQRQDPDLNLRQVANIFTFRS